MSVTREDVARMAALARVRLDPGEVDRLRTELSGILEHMEVLDRVDVSGLEEREAAGEAGAPEAGGAAGRAGDEEPDLLHRPPEAMAPEWRDGFFVVPRLPALEGDDLPDPAEGEGAPEEAE